MISILISAAQAGIAAILGLVMLYIAARLISLAVFNSRRQSEQKE